MSLKSRKELIKKVKDRYLKSNRREKTGILDELVKNTELNRNYLHQVLSPKIDLDYVNPINKKKRERYGPEVIAKLKDIWELFDYPCGQNLAPMLGEYIETLEKFKEMSFSLEVKQKLLAISSSTIDRRLKRSKKFKKGKVFSTTKPGSMLKKNIPIKTSCWNEKRIGFRELDTVAHCGDSASGEFILSLNYTDIVTQWTETVAVMGKAQIRIKQALDDIESRLPFPLLGIDPDNGGEFINWQLYRHCVNKDIEFTRGRPYHKNDNAHIEQKNWTHVRKLVGYTRLDKDYQLRVLNDLYRKEWRLFKNFFIANKKLISKKRIGTRIKKVYDKPRTPYQRLLESKEYPEEQKTALKAIYARLNPVKLKRSIDKKLKKI